MKGDSGAERTFTTGELAELCGLPENVVQRWIDRAVADIRARHEV